MSRTRLGRHNKTYAFMILALVSPIILGIYALTIGNWLYTSAFALCSLVNLDLFYHSNKKVMPYTFRILVRIESELRNEPYDPRLEED